MNALPAMDAIHLNVVGSGRTISCSGTTVDPTASSPSSGALGRSRAVKKIVTLGTSPDNN